MNTEINVEKEMLSGYNHKFKSRLYGLLCEREKNGEWEKFIDTILLELYGYPEERKTINYYILFYKISSLKYLRYKYFKNNIFECMNLLDNLGD